MKKNGEQKIQKAKSNKKLNKNMEEEIKYIVSLMKSGIKDGDIIRNFNMLDYYFNTKLNYYTFLSQSVKYLNSEELKTLHDFVVKNRNNEKATNKDIREFFNTKIETNCKNDSRGFPISGTGTIITTEEKENIINFLLSNNIPLTIKTINIALTRYSKETLELNKPLKKELK